MAGIVKFVPNPAGMAFLQASPAMQAMLLSVAEVVAKKTAEIGPVDEGDYISMIDAEAGVENGIALARVNAWDYKSFWIEFGTVDTPTFAPLRTAATASGLRLSKDTK